MICLICLILASLFLEFWKREQHSIQFRWNLTNFEEEEEPPRPEYLMKLAKSPYRKVHKVTGVSLPIQISKVMNKYVDL